MSVTTSAQLNVDQLQAALVALAPGSGYTTKGAALPTTGQKIITAIGATDGQLTSAITTAAVGQYVNYANNQSSIITHLTNHQASIQAWIAANPSGATPAAADFLVWAKTLNNLANLALQDYSSTGT